MFPKRQIIIVFKPQLVHIIFHSFATQQLFFSGSEAKNRETLLWDMRNDLSSPALMWAVGFSFLPLTELLSNTIT